MTVSGDWSNMDPPIFFDDIQYKIFIKEVFTITVNTSFGAN